MKKSSVFIFTLVQQSLQSAFVVSLASLVQNSPLSSRVMSYLCMLVLCPFHLNITNIDIYMRWHIVDFTT